MCSTVHIFSDIPNIHYIFTRKEPTDATPPTRVQKPQGSASTAPVPSVVLPVRSTAPMEKAPAASAPPVIPPADPVLFVGPDHYARVVKQALTPQARVGEDAGESVG